MLTDGYGLSLSTSSAAARDAYVEGCGLLLRMFPGAAEAFERATIADPRFALAHVGRARALQLSGNAGGARDAVAVAHGVLTGGLPSREASHIQVFDLLVGGKPGPALDALRRHVADWPRDALVVSLAANQTGLIGISGSRTREQDQLDFLTALAPHYGDHWWFNSHYAFALSELGHQSAARPRIEASIAQCPRNAWAAHTTAHFHYENGEPEASTSFLRAWLAAYPQEGFLYGHLSWHLAIVLLQTGEFAEALRLFDTDFAGDDHPGPALVKLLDAPQSKRSRWLFMNWPPTRRSTAPCRHPKVWSRSAGTFHRAVRMAICVSFGPSMAGQRSLGHRPARASALPSWRRRSSISSPVRS